MTALRAVDRGSYWELPLSGEAVTRCCVDEGFVLDLGLDKIRFVLRIEGRFSVTSSRGARAECVPGKPDSLAPAIALYGATVESCCAAKSGALDIEMTGGTSLHVEPDDTYEAWELGSGARGLRVVCGPGGELSIWQPLAQ